MNESNIEITSEPTSEISSEGISVSLVLATVGRTHELDRLLASIAGQTLKNIELIIVDQIEDDILRSGGRYRGHLVAQCGGFRAHGDAALQIQNHDAFVLTLLNV